MFKKIISFILIIIIGYYTYTYVSKDNIVYKEQKNQIDTELVNAKISKYHIYGTHFNADINLSLDNYDSINNVTLYFNGYGDTFEIPLIYEFNNDMLLMSISEYINDGIYLDMLEKNTYDIYIKVELIDDIKYYKLENDTIYKDLEYYSVSMYSKKISVTFSDTMVFNIIKSSNNKEVYDIVVDAGHGGRDSGAKIDNIYESFINLEIALKLKEKLEEIGLKVKLTRDSDMELEEYGKHGRAVIPYEVNAKYTLSIHANSTETQLKVGGLEIYTPMNIDYTFANNLAKNIVKSTGTNYSNNENYKVEDGVYTRNFTSSEIVTSKKEASRDGYIPYTITTSTPYYYMIRETGGIMTNAYVDGRNTKYDKNPYYDSNIGSETYLLELGYLTSLNDRELLINSKDKYVQGIIDSVKELLNIDQNQ